MKRIVVIFIILFSSFLHVQSESVFVEIKNDTVKIWNKQVDDNCAYSPFFKVDINDSLITIIESDTASDHTTCNCIFDLCVTLLNLESNDYRVNVYRKNIYNDSLQYIGSTSFSYIKTNEDTLIKSYYRSYCYDPQAIIEQAIIPVPVTSFLIESYPNPFNLQSRIKVYLPHNLFINLKLYDISGRLITVIISGTFAKGIHFFRVDARQYVSGNYFLILESGGKILKSVKISLLK